MMRIASSRKKTLFFLFLFILAGDFASKFAAKELLPAMDWLHPTYPYGGIGIFHDFFGIHFSLNYVENRGMAWGLFASHFEYLQFARGILIFSLVIYLLFINRDSRKQIPLVMIIAGAIGNLIDSFLYGCVIDFFHFNFWGYSFPVFNVADSFVSIGAVVLMVQTMLIKKSPQMPIPFKIDLPKPPK